MTKQKKSKTVSFFTQGCRLNQAESATLERAFEQEGFNIVGFNTSADIAVINTCTVTDNADKDAKRLVRKAAKHNKSVKVALIGCMAQIQKQALLDWPNVAWVVGNAQKMQLPHLIEDPSLEGEALVPKMKKEAFEEPLQGFDRHHVRANIKVQDGCDFFCSFCVIPFARGPARSRFFYDVLAESKELVKSGHKELVLTGINVGTYQDQGKFLLNIVSELDQLEDLKRIRISSIEPTTIDSALIDKMASKESKLCPYLHLPIQSGCDVTLKRMGRKYSLKDYCDFVEDVSSRVPDLCLGTDVIVGFPGETDDDFECTYQTLATLPFAYFHVFSYSERHFSRSRKLSDKCSSTCIAKRSERLRELSKRKQEAFYRNYIGCQCEVLIEQQKEGAWVGLTESFCKVKCDIPNLKRHDIVTVDIASLDGPYLVAEKR